MDEHFSLCWYPFLEGTSSLEVQTVEQLQTRDKTTYDYIILQDAMRLECDLLALLGLCKEKLNAKGHILLSVDNRLGMRYFAGTPENFSGQLFAGLQRFHQQERVSAFTKSELQQLVNEAGFAKVDWYYPYPDHRNTKEVFTAKQMPHGYGHKYDNYSKNALELFPEHTVMQDVCKEGVGETFANSFFLDLMMGDKENAPKVLYAKMNWEREDAYQIMTRILEKNGEKYIEKTALTDVAVHHMRKLYEFEQAHQEGDFAYLAGEWMEYGIRYPFLNGKTCDAKVKEALNAGDKHAVLDLLQQVMDGVYPEKKQMGIEVMAQEFCQVFGTLPEELVETWQAEEKKWQCVGPANVDLICGNVFIEDNRHQLIDGEWVFDFYVPEKFLYWRMVNELKDSHGNLLEVISEEELWEHFQISEKERDAFTLWNQHFTLEYVGCKRALEGVQQRVQVKPEELLPELEVMRGQLYLDYGQGFHEEDKLQVTAKREGEEFVLDFEIPRADEVQGMRFDPVENKMCRCKLWAVVDDKRHDLKAANADALYEDMEEFWNLDPQYEVPSSKIQNGHLNLRAKYKSLNAEEVMQVSKKLYDEIYAKRNPLRQIMTFLKN